MAAHAAHKCTQIIIFLTINILSLISFVCKVKKLCAKRAFCVQSGGMCAECVQICAGRVQIFDSVCCSQLLVNQNEREMCAAVCMCVQHF